MLRFAGALLATFLFASCMDDPQVDTSQYAIDTNHSGTFDCHDLDTVHGCIDHHIADACALTDINHDAVTSPCP
jgi:hypothetical protein